jgi:nitrogen fixation-related uncharacterized protein
LLLQNTRDNQFIKREDLFWITILVHGHLALLLWACGEGDYDDQSVWWKRQMGSRETERERERKKKTESVEGPSISFKGMASMI